MNKSVKTEKIISFGLFFIFLAVVFLMIPVTYAINDDTAMRGHCVWRHVWDP